MTAAVGPVASDAELVDADLGGIRWVTQVHPGTPGLLLDTQAGGQRSAAAVNLGPDLLNRGFGNGENLREYCSNDLGFASGVLLDSTAARHRVPAYPAETTANSSM